MLISSVIFHYYSQNCDTDYNTDFTDSSADNQKVISETRKKTEWPVISAEGRLRSVQFRSDQNLECERLNLILISIFIS